MAETAAPAAEKPARAPRQARTYTFDIYQKATLAPEPEDAGKDTVVPTVSGWRWVGQVTDRGAATALEAFVNKSKPPVPPGTLFLIAEADKTVQLTTRNVTQIVPA